MKAESIGQEMVECIPSYFPVTHCEALVLARLRNPRATLPISITSFICYSPCLNWKKIFTFLFQLFSYHANHMLNEITLARM